MRRTALVVGIALAGVVAATAALVALVLNDDPEAAPRPRSPTAAEFEWWMLRFTTGDVVERCRVVRRFSASGLSRDENEQIVLRAARDREDGVRYYLVVECADHPEWITEGTIRSFVALAEDKDEIISFRASCALRKACARNDVALATMRETARTGSPRSRSSALYALAESGRATDDDVAAIVAALNDADDSVVYAAISCVGRLGPRAKSSVSRLMQLLVRGSDAGLAAESLSIVAPDCARDQALVAGVVEGLSSRDGFARCVCCRLLRRVEGLGADVLSRLDAVASDDPSDATRVAAIVTLAILRHDATQATTRLEAIRVRRGRWLAIYVDEEVRWTGEKDVVALALERRFWRDD
jgi:hypothetical protein